MWQTLLFPALLALAPASAPASALSPNAQLGVLSGKQQAFRRELFLLHYDTGELHAFDPETYVVRVVGETGLQEPGALGAGPDGLLYSFTTDGRVWKIDPEDAQTILVGSLGLGSVFEGGLAIDQDGRALGLNAGNGFTPGLFEVDLTTGSARLLGSVGIGDFNGLAFRKDGKLIGLDRIHNALWVIDPDDLSRTLLVSLLPVVGGAGGLTIRDGLGFFATGGTPGTFGGTHELWSFDPFTGNYRRVIPLPDSLEGVGVAGLCLAGGEVSEEE